MQDGMDLDDLLPQIGEFGRYQKLLLWLVCLPACVPCGFCAFNQLFMADVPDHWCLVPELMDYPMEMRKKLAIPYDVSSIYIKKMGFINYSVEKLKIRSRPSCLVLNVVRFVQVLNVVRQTS